MEWERQKKYGKEKEKEKEKGRERETERESDTLTEEQLARLLDELARPDGDIRKANAEQTEGIAQDEIARIAVRMRPEEEFQNALAARLARGFYP